MAFSVTFRDILFKDIIPMTLLICFKTIVNFHVFNGDYIELINTYENSLNNVTLHPQMENIHATCQCTDLT